MRWCLALAIALAMCRTCLAAPPGRQDAQADPRAVLLLEEAARHSADIVTLSAGFRQEKKLGILARPLASQGYLCVDRAPAGQGDRLLWVYTSPAPAGFIYENGQGALWEENPAGQRQAGPQEAAAIAAVVRHILAWIRIDAQEMQQAYRLERPESDPPALLLFPRRQSFFVKLEAVFAPDLDSLRQLTFFEANGDTVRIMFSETRINRALPERCSR